LAFKRQAVAAGAGAVESFGSERRLHDKLGSGLCIVNGRFHKIMGKSPEGF
jgi:hypothetical protein